MADSDDRASRPRTKTVVLGMDIFVAEAPAFADPARPPTLAHPEGPPVTRPPRPAGAGLTMMPLDTPADLPVRQTSDDDGQLSDEQPSDEQPDDAQPLVAVSGFVEQYGHLDPVLVAFAGTEAHDLEHARLRERLVTGFLPVARYLARRYANRGEPVEDLIQVASVGLLHAIDRFDPGRGYPFLGFAVPTITGEIRRHFRDKTLAIRVPRGLKDLYISITLVTPELTHRLGRAPRPSELATHLRVAREEVLEALTAGQAYYAGSLDEPLGEGATAARPDIIGSPDAWIDQFIDSRVLAPFLAALPRREYDILIMRFFQDMTQSQIAEKVGVSQMHISRLLATTLGKLREAVDSDPPPANSAGMRCTPARNRRPAGSSPGAAGAPRSHAS